MTLPEVAETFHSNGFNVLLYDARSVGASDGEPRNLLDPLRIAEELAGEYRIATYAENLPSWLVARDVRHCWTGLGWLTFSRPPADIVTYVAGLPTVDSRNIVLWGMSFGAAVSACAAAIDQRPKALVMVCPLFDYVQPHKADKAFSLLIKDRVSQLRGNDPYYLAPFTSSGDNLIGMGGAGGPGGMEAFRLMSRAAESNHPDFRDQISLQTYQKLAMWRPKAYMDMIKSPTMIIIPELDNISSPLEQQDAFNMLKSPKKLYWAKGKGHLSILTGEGSHELIMDTVRWLEEIVGGEKC